MELHNKSNTIRNFGMTGGLEIHSTPQQGSTIYCPQCAVKIPVRDTTEDSCGVTYMAYCNGCGNNWDIERSNFN